MVWHLAQIVGGSLINMMLWGRDAGRCATLGRASSRPVVYTLDCRDINGSKNSTFRCPPAWLWRWAAPGQTFEVETLRSGPWPNVTFDAPLSTSGRIVCGRDGSADSVWQCVCVWNVLIDLYGIITGILQRKEGAHGALYVDAQTDTLELATATR